MEKECESYYGRDHYTNAVCVRVLNLHYVRRKLPYVFSSLNNNTGYRLFMTTNNAFGSGSRVP